MNMKKRDNDINSGYQKIALRILQVLHVLHVLHGRNNIASKG